MKNNLEAVAGRSPHGGRRVRREGGGLMLGKKRPREPHQDPQMEARLLRIITLRESAASKEALSCQYAVGIGILSAARRRAASLGERRNAADMETRLKDLQQELRQLEDEIAAVHDDIAALTEELWTIT